MNVAILLQCHKNPQQINLLLDAMKHPAFTFFVHIDKKSNIASKIQNRKDVIILPDELQIDVQWGKITQVDATLNLLEYAQNYGSYDYFWICSGQDFPIKSSEEIVQYLTENKGHDFFELFYSKNYGLGCSCNYDKRNELFFPEWILGKGIYKKICKRLYVEVTGGYNHTFSWAKRAPVNNVKFFFGSCWMCLSAQTVLWINEYLSHHSEYYEFFSNCICPDESFFQTLIMNSPFGENRMDYLHYLEWEKGKNSPQILTMEDYPKLITSDKLMARKFDTAVDSKVLNELIRKRLKK